MRKTREGGGPPKRKTGSGEPAKPDAFDEWLKRGLHKLYGQIADDPVPQDILDMIDRDREEEPHGKG